jgi:hypothetical protein
VAARSKAWFSGRFFAGITGSNPAEDHGCLSVVSVVLSGRGLCVQTNVTECAVSEYDLKAS